MLISPPFIPEPIANESDEAFVARSMPGCEPGNGSFPLSYDLGWHGGMHISAPMAAGNILPVRAIADGVVAYFRQPEPVIGNPEHPLNYRGGWTDNGCLVLRHETEIGEGPEASVVFYSIYMHLSSITLENPQQGQQIYRKDSIGLAGRIYGQPNKIHFEIISSQEQVARLTGRSTAELNLATSGRTDSFWGDMHFYIPPEVLFYAARPANPRDTNNTSEIVHRPPEAYFLKMNYKQGQCTLTTFSELGEQQGLRQEKNDYEYNLYRTASTLYPQCISAGYELLRFGRVLGPDRLQPANAAHWRQIAYPGGVGWVNLNSLTVTQYSDADFPHWLGWKLIDDDVDGDSRCQSQRILSLIGLAAPPATVDQRTVAQAVLSDADSQQKTKRLICHFPTEWRRADIDSRYAWLIAGESPILTQESFYRLRSHLQALAFWEDAALEGISESHWHFPPKEFIAHYKKCTWLSPNEFINIYPNAKLERVQSYLTLINKTAIKYLVAGSVRRAHFFGQAGVETNQLLWMSELYNGDPYNYFRRYANAQNFVGWLGNIKWHDGGDFRGRGMKQLTGRANYADYWVYRGWLARNSYSDRWWRNSQWWGIAGNNVTQLTQPQRSTLPIQNAATVARLEAEMLPPQITNPDRVNSEPATSIDTAGWFWSKNSLLRIADSNSVEEMTRRIRGDGPRVGIDMPWPAAANFPQRQQMTENALKYIGDQTDA